MTSIKVNSASERVWNSPLSKKVIFLSGDFWFTVAWPRHRQCHRRRRRGAWKHGGGDRGTRRPTPGWRAKSRHTFCLSYAILTSTKTASPSIARLIVVHSKDRSGRNALASVAIVNKELECVYEKFVQPPSDHRINKSSCQFCPVTDQQFEIAHYCPCTLFAEVRQDVLQILQRWVIDHNQWSVSRSGFSYRLQLACTFSPI